MKNKRGDLPVTLLVIGVILICSLALFSFFYSSFYVGQSLVGVSQIEELNSKIDQYYFYKEMGVAEEQINLALEIEDGKIFIEENPENFVGKEKFLFSVRYRLP